MWERVYSIDFVVCPCTTEVITCSQARISRARNAAAREKRCTLSSVTLCLSLSNSKTRTLSLSFTQTFASDDNVLHLLNWHFEESTSQRSQEQEREREISVSVYDWRIELINQGFHHLFDRTAKHSQWLSCSSLVENDDALRDAAKRKVLRSPVHLHTYFGA